MNGKRNQKILLFIFVAIMGMSLMGFENFSRVAPERTTTGTGSAEDATSPASEQNAPPQEENPLGRLFQTEAPSPGTPQPLKNGGGVQDQSPTPAPSPTPTQGPRFPKPLILTR